MLARAPVLQEDLTEDLANLFHTRLASDGSAVFVEGMHLCMAARGVGAHEARLSTTAVRGKLAEPGLRQEFMKLATTVP
jgi:GTP cyclohydrolase I